MWTSDIVDSDLITDEKADFLLAEAKEQLASTVEDAEALTKTGIYLLGGLLTITSGLVGVTATLFNDAQPIAGQKWSAILPLLVTSVYLTADSAIIMWSALSTKGLDHRGNEPRNIATQELFQLDLRLIKFAEAANYQERIERNHSRNERVGVRINRGIKAGLSHADYLSRDSGHHPIHFPPLVPPVARIPVIGELVGRGTAGLVTTAGLVVTAGLAGGGMEAGYG